MRLSERDSVPASSLVVSFDAAALSGSPPTHVMAVVWHSSSSLEILIPLYFRVDLMLAHSSPILALTMSVLHDLEVNAADVLNAFCDDTKQT